MNQHLTQDHLIDYLHHALAPEDDAAVFAHLQGCAQCQAALREETALTEALQRQAAAEERDLPAGVQATIWAKVEALDAPVSLGERLRAWLRPAVLVPIAAVLILGLFLAPQLFRRAPQSIDAAYYLDDHAAVNGTIPFGDASETIPASLTSTGNPVDASAVAVDPVTVTADVRP
jgi:anti-sigma factor RsiW